MKKQQSSASNGQPMRPASWFWPTAAAIFVIVVTVLLGRWQLDRAHMREAREARYASLAALPPVVIGGEPIDGHNLDYHRVSARGRWLTRYGIFLDNQVHQGQDGYDVYMPLRLEGSDLNLLVDRGWIAAGGDRRRLPEVKTPGGRVEVSGSVLLPLRFKEYGTTYREGRIWENVTLERFRAWSGLELQPVIVRQSDDPGDGLIRDWPRPDSGADRNRGYAFQWFAFALLTCLLWVYHFFRRRSSDAG